MLLTSIKDGDFTGIRKNFQKLGSLYLGERSAQTFAELTLTGLTASRLVSTDSAKKLTSVSDLTNWIAGTANEIDITDDADGTITVGIVDPLIVAKGGTGAATLTDHGILLGSGTDAITPLGAATNGQLPIGSAGADPVLATLTGTTNQITVTNAAGSITLSAPQDLHTGASPTFAGLTIPTLTGVLKATAGVFFGSAAHADLASIDSNQHIDHTGVSITAGTGMSGGGTIAATRTLNCTITQYTDALARASISETVTGLDYNNTTGVLSLTSGYVIPTTTQETNWGTAYTHSGLTSGNPHSVTKAEIGLGSVENTALSTWAGSTNITTLGTISSCAGISFTDSDISQPATEWASATTYLKVETDSATNGGARLWGFSDDAGQRALVFLGAIGSSNPIDTVPAFLLVGARSSGTTLTTMADSDTVIQFENWGTALLTVLGNGNVGINDINPGEKLDVNGNINVTGVHKVDDVQVVSNRVIDARCDDVINSGDATTDGVIDALRDAMITHGLIAAA